MSTSTLTIGMIFTSPLQDHESPVESIGAFELPVTVSQQIFLNSGDKLGYVRTCLAHHLASAIYDTKVPVEYWKCKLTPDIAREFNLPTTFSFAGR